MFLTNFRDFRINDNGNFVDVKATGDNHCSDSFYMVAYEHPNMPTKDYMKRNIKIMRKERQVATFVSRHNEIEIPSYWQDAELIYEWNEK